jgi:hypothetical protein
MAFLADSLIKSGVSKSGSPKLKEIISCPSAFYSRLIRAIASVADSANRFNLSEKEYQNDRSFRKVKSIGRISYTCNGTNEPRIKSRRT